MLSKGRFRFFVSSYRTSDVSRSALMITRTKPLTGFYPTFESMYLLWKTSISNDTPLCKVGPSHQLRSGVTLTTPTEVLRPRPSAYRTSSGGRVVGLGPGICCLFWFSVVKAEVWGWIVEWKLFGVQVKSETPWDCFFTWICWSSVDLSSFQLVYALPNLQQWFFNIYPPGN